MTYCHRRITVTLQPGMNYLDLSLLYSSANHRAMKQGHIFQAKFQLDGDTALGANGADEQFILETLPTTWPVFGAYKQAKKVFDLAMKPEKGLTAKKSRWHDFKVYYDTAHKTADLAGTKICAGGCTLDFDPASGNADFAYSQVKDDSGANTYTYHMLGVSDMTGTDRSYGMLMEYDRSDNTDTESNSGLYTNYHEILNDINTANDQHLQESGDKPPYNSANLQLPSNQYNIFVFGAGTGEGEADGYAIRSTPFIDVPFGLVKINNNIAAPRQLQVVFKAGTNKGIAAEAVR